MRVAATVTEEQLLSVPNRGGMKEQSFLEIDKLSAGAPHKIASAITRVEADSLLSQHQ